jgi:hypothetical protein
MQEMSDHNKPEVNRQSEEVDEALGEKLSKKFHTLFSLAGIRDEVFPGIRLAFFPVYAILIQFQEQILSWLGLVDVKPVVAYITLGLGAVLGSILLWAVSGYIFDPLYDLLYGDRGLWTRTPGRKLWFFSSGYDLDQFRKHARSVLANENSVYNNHKISIRKPALEKLRKGDAELYKEVKSELENSKSFRTALLPVIFLGGWFIWNKEPVPALVAVTAFVVLVELSFRARAGHSLMTYRWLATNPQATKT